MTALPTAGGYGPGHVNGPALLPAGIALTRIYEVPRGGTRSRIDSGSLPSPRSASESADLTRTFMTIHEFHPGILVSAVD